MVSALKFGKIKPSQLIVDYVTINGQKVILNTRTSTALLRAGIPRSKWAGKDVTGVAVPGAPNGVTFDTLAKKTIIKGQTYYRKSG